MQNMLGNSRSISRSIELFISDTVDSMRNVTLDKKFIKGIGNIEQYNEYEDKLETFYRAGGEEIDSVYFIDKNGSTIAQHPKALGSINEVVLKDIKTAIAKQSTYIGNAYLDKDKSHFILNIYEPVFQEGNFKGMLSAAINLNVIYDKLIAPVKIGEKGYALVKDQEGIIIMHTVKEQVGMDVIESRKQVYPGLDYRELEDLIQNQLKGKEGTAIYHSYWWGDNVLKKARKLNAYTPVKLGDHFWIVALTMSYDEIQGPINKFLAIIISIAGLIVVIIYFFLAALIKMKKNKEELEKETKYLKMLNETSEQLRKKEAELYHSHKLKMIGTLAGGIAHDINNLLTPILGYSELLMMQIPETEDYYEEAEEIYKASQKGKELIEQILLFSRKDNGIVKIEPVNINEVTGETIKLLKAVIPKNITIKENFKEQCGYVNANFTQLHQVIFNLGTNAYQAIKDSKGTIEINLKNISGSEAKSLINTLAKDFMYVELEIKDTGIGMDEETKSRIFDPFFTTKEIGGGTGLGLFVAQSIIDKYGGVIKVESKEGVGSSFKIYLPIIDKTPDGKHKEERKNKINSNKKILIVDDNKEVTSVLKKGLGRLGYNVTVENDCLKALELFKLKNKKFDLVITDYIMPKLKGNELALSIKELNKDIPIILITGYMEENIEDIKSVGVIDEHLQKPIELNELSRLMDKLLNSKI
jgi:signal transduction histidine kinase/CheY-like chemotaxis protein